MKKIYVYPIAAIIIIGMLFLFFFKGNSDLKRLRFSVSEGNELLLKTEKDIETESIVTEDIPNAQVFKFSGKFFLSFKPERKGRAGLFFTLNVKSLNGKKVETKVVLKRKEVGITLKRYYSDSYYHSFSKEMSFNKEDKIEVRLSGDGIIALNSPVVYTIKKRSERRYVFVIALDTLRSDMIGRIRNGVKLTPNISKLKKDSVVFSNTFAQSNWTLASFMSFFTSLYEFNHRATKDFGLDKEINVLTGGLREKFFTFNLNSGLWMKGKYGFSRGFDFFNVYSFPKDNLGGKKLFKKTIDFLNNTNIPSLFMFLHTYQIHSPYDPPTKFLYMIDKDPKYKNLDTYFYKKQYRNGISKDERNAMEELYEAEILAFDTYFGKFLSYLKEKGIYEDSMIVFVSDHGEEFFEHKGWSHGHSVYNDVIKVPFMIKFPANKFKGKIVDTNVGLIDVLPTVYDFFNINQIENIDGTTLMPLVKGDKFERELLFSSTTITRLVKEIPPKFAIIKDNFKLICNYKFSDKNLSFFSEYGEPPEESEIAVYNIKKDYSELFPVKGKMYGKIFGGFKKVFISLKKIIKINSERKTGKKLTLSEEEKKKLESLGYFQK